VHFCCNLIETVAKLHSILASTILLKYFKNKCNVMVYFVLNYIKAGGFPADVLKKIEISWI
jgi:hypothetical protein